MPVVPCSLDELLFLFAGAFSPPTFATFRHLVVGFVCRVGHHSRAHVFFAYREWYPDQAGC